MVLGWFIGGSLVGESTRGYDLFPGVVTLLGLGLATAGACEIKGHLEKIERDRQNACYIAGMKEEWGRQEDQIVPNLISLSVNQGEQTHNNLGELVRRELREIFTTAGYRPSGTRISTPLHNTLFTKYGIQWRSPGDSTRAEFYNISDAAANAATRGEETGGRVRVVCQQNSSAYALAR